MNDFGNASKDNRNPTLLAVRRPKSAAKRWNAALPIDGYEFAVSLSQCPDEFGMKTGVYHSYNRRITTTDPYQSHDNTDRSDRHAKKNRHNR